MTSCLSIFLVLSALHGFESRISGAVDRRPSKQITHSIPQQGRSQASLSTGSTPIRTFSIKQHPYYAPYIVRALSNLVAQHGKTKRNHFFISKIDEYANGYDGPWIYWKERQILMTWDQNVGTNKDGELAPQFDLVSWWPRHVHRLNKDLVDGPYANGNDRLTRRDATEIIRVCIREGDLFILR